MELNLETLGFSKEELQNRVVEKIANDLFLQNAYDPDEGEFRTDSKFGREIQALVKKRIDDKVEGLPSDD